jgi:hypothetical protein
VAHKICEMLDRANGKKAIPCNHRCRHWMFPHLDRACVLSEVYSVCKGELCYTFEEDTEE